MSSQPLDCLKIVISDLHIGTGVRRGEVNLYEDFHEDARFADLLDFYSSGPYRDAPVELILNGDIFDLLKVDVEGKFTEEITEAMSLQKLASCLEGHSGFVAALQRFLSLPEKTISYLPGNHDIDLYFPRVSELFVRTVAQTQEAAKKIRVITDSDAYYLPDGVQISHGHQFEAMNRFDLKRFTLPRAGSDPVINLPWGSIFVLRVINPLKAQRPYIDHVSPFKLMILLGIFLDFRFTMKLLFRVVLHFLRTRFFDAKRRRAGFFTTIKILLEELSRMEGIDHAVKKILRRSGRAVSTIICGHTHNPKIRRFGGGKLYVNTGSWVRNVHLGLDAFGQKLRRTYALIEYRGGVSQARLLEWYGRSEVSEELFY